MVDNAKSAASNVIERGKDAVTQAVGEALSAMPNVDFMRIRKVATTPLPAIGLDIDGTLVDSNGAQYRLILLGRP